MTQLCSLNQKPIEGLDNYIDINGLGKELMQIENSIISITSNCDVLIDSELIENLQSFFEVVMFI